MSDSMDISKMIADALREARESLHTNGPELPLCFAAKTACAKHKAILDEYDAPLKLAQLEVKRIENRIEEEQTRWLIEMGQVQPETKEGCGFQLNNEGTMFRVTYHNKKSDDSDDENKPLFMARSEKKPKDQKLN